MVSQADIDRIKKQIKKNNGEKFLHALQRYNAIFRIPNIVEILKYAGGDPESIVPTLLSLLDKRPEPVPGVSTDWKELLSMAGYDAYYANTLKKQNAIKKYFVPGEELCTFDDPTRFQKYYIVHAVKKGAGDLQRINFYGKERRQDEYGTSVISIQIPKSGGFVFITNRYNHTVLNADETFDADPDEIIPGLSFALKKAFHVDFNMGAAYLPSHCRMDEDGRIFKFLFEKNGIYFSNSGWLEHGQINKIDPDSQILFGHIILDAHQKRFDSPITRYKKDKEVMPILKLVKQLNRAFKNVKRFAITVDKAAGTKSVWAIGKDKQEIVRMKVDGSEIIELNYPGKELPESFGIPVRRINAPQLKKIDAALASTARELNAPDGLVIDGCVNLGRQRLLKLPDFSRYIVKGSFYCDCNFLVDLRGAPKEVTGVFYFGYNPWLKSVRGAPVKVGSFDGHKNFNLRSLVGGPKVVRDYMDCNSCSLESLEGAPETIGTNFYCDDNYLVDFRGGPKFVGRAMTCSDNNLVSFVGIPKFIGGDLIVTRNPLMNVGKNEGLPTKIGGEFLYQPYCRSFRKRNPVSEQALVKFSRAVYTKPKDAFPKKRVRDVINECKNLPLSVKGRACIKVLEEKLADCRKRGASKERE